LEAIVPQRTQKGGDGKAGCTQDPQSWGEKKKKNGEFMFAWLLGRGKHGTCPQDRGSEEGCWKSRRSSKASATACSWERTEGARVRRKESHEMGGTKMKKS